MWSWKISCFPRQLENVVVSEIQPRAFDLGVEKDINNGKRRRLEFVLVVELLNGWIISRRVIRRFPVEINSSMHVEIPFEKDIRVRKLRIHEEIGNADSVIVIFKEQRIHGVIAPC